MLRKRLMTLALAVVMTVSVFTGCGSKDDSKTSRSESKKTEQQKSDAKKEKAAEKEETKAPIEDGTYTAEFKTDSSMFHVNDAYDDKGTLTVKDGKMTIHISLVSKNIVNLFPGTIKDAKKKGAKLLQPTTDTITDENGNVVTDIEGKPKEVYGFDVPVPALDKEFDLALIGKKGTWYDHKVSVSNPEPKEDDAKSTVDLEDGTYTAEVTLEGGSGRATIESPATITVKDGVATASIVWSSPNYDYMIVDGKKLFPVNTEGNSVFEIPVASFDTELDVIADTVAMSKPHEIEYTLAFDSSTIKTAE